MVYTNASNLLAQWRKATGDSAARDRIMQSLMALVGEIEELLDTKADTEAMIRLITPTQITVERHEAALRASATAMTEGE